MKAILRTPEGEEEALTADGEGYFRYHADKPGQYLLSIAHQREPFQGFHAGRAYE